MYSPISVPMWSPSLHRDLAVAGLVPALAGHVELQLERRLVVAVPVVEVAARAAGAFERLDLADEDAVHQRAGAHRARRGGRGIEPGRCSRLPSVLVGARTRVGDALSHLGRARSARRGRAPRRGSIFLMTLLPPRVRGLHADGYRAGDAARGQHELLELRLVARRPLDLFVGLDAGTGCSISPSRQSSNSSCRANLSERIVGASVIVRRVVQVVRVRRDDVRDQHAVDADELLDGELGRLGLASSRR